MEKAVPDALRPEAVHKGMLIISPSIRIPLSEISFACVRASGPGGQHVNKTSSAVQLRFDIFNSPSLSADVKRRLAQAAGRRVSTAGELIIEAQRFRSQEANRRDALERLNALILHAARPPRARRPTSVPRAERRRRLAGKRLRAQVKKMRSRTADNE